LAFAALAQGAPPAQSQELTPIVPQQSAEYAGRIGPPFANCDGYGEPTKSGDGMATMALRMGIFIDPGGRRRSVPSLGRSGVLACNIALGELQSRPTYWMRRVSLLRARAIHRIAEGDLTGAQADLDAADAAAAQPDEPYYRRSLRLGVDLVRALALRRSGQSQAAEKLALSVSNARPFSKQTALAALVAIGPDADFAVRGALLRRVAQLDPNACGELYDATFEQGEYAKAVELYGALQPAVKGGDEPMELRQRLLLEQDNRAEAARFWVAVTGERAYALAALGRADDARAALADARARFAAATPAPDPLPEKASDKERLQSAIAEQTNLKIRNLIPPVLNAWSGLTEARLLLAEGKEPEAAARFHAIGKLPASSATIDFLQAAVLRLPPQERPDLATWRSQMRAARGTPAPGDELRILAGGLPEAETLQRVPAVHHSNWLYTVNGYSETRTAESSTLTVKYRDVDTTEAMAQEAALLRAAELGEKSGKNAMLVTGMRDIQHTVIVTLYSSPINSLPSGFETDMDVTFVDAAASQSTDRWRLIDLATVRAELSALYRPKTAANQGGEP
jgi:hypothetical protein